VLLMDDNGKICHHNVEATSELNRHRMGRGIVSFQNFSRQSLGLFHIAVWLSNHRSHVGMQHSRVSSRSRIVLTGQSSP